MGGRVAEGSVAGIVFKGRVEVLKGERAIIAVVEDLGSVTSVSVSGIGVTGRMGRFC